MLSISDISARSCATHGRTRSPTMMSSLRLTQQQYMLSERRLCWLGHVPRIMNKGHIHKDLMYGQLECGTKSKSRSQLRFKDSCKRDPMSTHIDINTWEDIAVDQLSWRHAVNQGIQRVEEDRRVKHDLRKASSCNTIQLSTFISTDCTKDCHSRIGLYSHCSLLQENRIQPIVYLDGWRPMMMTCAVVNFT